MLSTVKMPKTKNELITALNAKQPLNYVILEGATVAEIAKMHQIIDKMLKKSQISIIIVSEK
jgi:hypothetical protein